MEQATTPARTVEPFEPRLTRIGAVDAVALEARAADLAKRSIKRGSKLEALDLIVRMIDLTTLEGADTPGKVAALCAKAMRPDPVDPSVPSVAAVCGPGPVLDDAVVSTVIERSVAAVTPRVAAIDPVLPLNEMPFWLKSPRRISAA